MGMSGLKSIGILMFSLLSQAPAFSDSKVKDDEKSYAKTRKSNEQTVSLLKNCTRNCNFGAEVKFQFVPETSVRMDKVDAKDFSFHGSEFRSVYWNDSHLKNVSFRNIDFVYTYFEKSKMENVQFENITGKARLIFDGSSIDDMTFKDFKGQSLSFRQAKISRLTLDNTTLSKGVDFNAASIRDSNFQNMHFTGIFDLTGAVIEKSNFTRATFDRFPGIDLQIKDSDFSETVFKQEPLLDVKGSKFVNAIIENGKGGYLNCQDSDFSGIIVKSVNFRLTSINCNFSNADLSLVKITSAKHLLQKTNFCNAKMPDGSLGKCLD